MFATLFEERDKKISYLVKLGDCMGRSLRKNIALFSIDAQNNHVTYLSEDKKVISGNYEIGKDVTLHNILIQESSVYEDGNIFDNFVNTKIESFVESIHNAEYSSADDSFSDILSLWENRLKIDSIQAKLYQKAERFEKSGKIIQEASFQKLLEVTPQLISFLEENAEKITKVPEIQNAINLSNTVSDAFNFPKLTYDNLEEGKSYILKDGISDSIYEMICQQELVKKELVESKKEFDLIWATNSSVRKLANMIFESDEKIVKTLCEALKEVPYIALASKKSLFDTFSSCLGDADGIGVSDKDIQKYSSKIFEIKKEAKGMFIESMSENYGVNIQNLQEPPSFKSLINTQVVIFEALSRLSPKNSILKEVLSENALMLKSKNGIEGIDVNNYLQELFAISACDQILEARTKEKENPYMKKAEEKVDTDKLSKDLANMGKVIAALQNTVAANADQEYPSDENVDQQALAAQEVAPAQAAPPAAAVPPEEAVAPEAAPPVPEEKVLNDLTELENMVAEIADELGVMDDVKDELEGKPEKESKKKSEKSKDEKKDTEK